MINLIKNSDKVIKRRALNIGGLSESLLLVGSYFLKEYNNDFLKRGVFILSLFFVCSSLFGQTVYPVQTNVTVNQPYSLNLSDYTHDNFRFQVIMQLIDQQSAEIEVYINLDITGPNGIRLKTINGYGPVSVDQSPMTVDGNELYQLFDLNNLDFSGITKDVYIDQGGLPEGVYQFNVEVVEKQTNQVVSNPNIGGYIAFIRRPDPPMLNIPIDGHVINPAQNQPLVFQWTPRQQSFNVESNISYRLKISEVIPSTRNPYDAMNSEPFIFDQEIQAPQTTYIFMDADPELIPGMRYAWQVQVVDETNQGVYKNNGYSEVYTFDYAAHCPKVNAVTIEPELDDMSARVLWGDEIEQSEFEVYYRPFEGGESWSIKNTNNNELTLDNLHPATTYEVKVRAKCDNEVIGQNNEAFTNSIASDFVNAGRVTMPDNEWVLCEAPTRIRFNASQLTWGAANGINNYIVNYRQQGENEWISQEVTDTSFNMEDVAFPVEVRVDVNCVNQSIKEGNIQVLNDENDRGSCAPPEPINFRTSALEEQVSLSWSSYSEHTAFDLRFRLQGSQEEWILFSGLNEPTLLTDEIIYGEVFEYQIKFHCDENASEYSTVDYFMVERTDDEEDEEDDPEDTADCFPPGAKVHEVLKSDKVRISWDEEGEANEYILYYRKKGETIWSEETSYNTNKKLKNLEEDAVYEYKLSCMCDEKESIFTEVGEFDLSEITIDEDCPLVQEIDTTETGKNHLALTWPEEDNHSNYKVQYKTINQSVTEWYQKMVSPNDLPVIINELRKNTTYDIRVTAYCGTSETPSSDIVNYKTRRGTEPPEDFECGNTGDACDRHAGGTLSSLYVGDTFGASDFEVEVTEVIGGGSGTFSGEGILVVPYMDHAQMKVEFENISINEAACLTDGELIMTGSTFYVLPSSWAERIEGVLSAVDDAFDEVENYADMAERYYDQMNAIVDAATTPVDLSEYENMTPQEMFEEGKRLYEEGREAYKELSGGDADISEALDNIATGAALIRQAMELGGAVVQELSDYFFQFKELMEEELNIRIDLSDTRLGALAESVEENLNRIGEKGDEQLTDGVVEIGENGEIDENNIFFIGADYDESEATEVSEDLLNSMRDDEISGEMISEYEAYIENELERYRESLLLEMLEEMNTEGGLDNITHQFSTLKQQQLSDIVPQQEVPEGEEPEMSDEQTEEVKALIEDFINNQLDP